MLELQRIASSRGATYVQIFRIVEPHLAATNCFDNRLQIHGVAFSGAAERSSSDDIDPDIALGTCFAVSEDGIVVTAAHVVSKSDDIKVAFSDSEVIPAKRLVVSEESDVAILEVARRTDAFVSLSHHPPRLGEPVFTVGFPAASAFNTSVKFTEGSISATADADRDLVQISVPIHPGNSGGPLLNFRGEVVGVVVASARVSTFLEETGSLPQNVNFAVPASSLGRLLQGRASKPPAASRSAAIERATGAVCRVFAESS